MLACYEMTGYCHILGFYLQPNKTPHFPWKIKTKCHSIPRTKSNLECKLKNDMNHMYTSLCPRRTMRVCVQMVLIYAFHQKSRIIFFSILDLERLLAIVVVNIIKLSTVSILTSKYMRSKKHALAQRYPKQIPIRNTEICLK